MMEGLCFYVFQISCATPNWRIFLFIYYSSNENTVTNNFVAIRILHTTFLDHKERYFNPELANYLECAASLFSNLKKLQTTYIQ